MSDKTNADNNSDRIVIHMELDDEDDFDLDTDSRGTYSARHRPAATSKPTASTAVTTAAVSSGSTFKRRHPAAAAPVSLISDDDDGRGDDDFESSVQRPVTKKPRTAMNAAAAPRKPSTASFTSTFGSNRGSKLLKDHPKDLEDDDWDLDLENPRVGGGTDSDLDGLDDFAAPADPQLADLERSEKDKAVHDALKTAVHHGIGRIVALEESQLDASMPREVTAAVAKVTHAQLELWARDLAAFAKHRGRSTVTSDDVLLLARRNPSLTSALDLYLQERNNPQ